MSKNTIDPEWLPDVRAAEHIGLSTMTLWRFDHLPEYAHLNFPKPAVINKRKYRRRADLDEWMRSRIVDGAEPREVKAKKIQGGRMTEAAMTIDPRAEVNTARWSGKGRKVAR